MIRPVACRPRRGPADRGLRGRPELPAAGRAAGCRLHAGEAGGPDRDRRHQERCRAALRCRQGHPGRVVDAVPFRAARPAGAARAPGQSRCRCRPGRAAPGAGERLRRRRRAVPLRQRKLPAGARRGSPAPEFGEPKLSPTFSLVTAQLSVSYAPDVFGGTRRQIESLRAQAEYQRFELEATYLTLTSNVVAAAVNEASLRGQIAATEQIIKAEADQLELVRQQFATGGASRADLLTQQATLAQSRATLPPLRKQLAQQRDQLAALAGGFPSQAARRQLRSCRPAPCRPICRSACRRSLSSSGPTCARRQAQFHAASANLGVAIANQLPQFNITATLGTDGPGLHQPVHAGDRRVEHRRRHHPDAVRRRHAAAQEARRGGGAGCRRRRSIAAR